MNTLIHSLYQIGAIKFGNFILKSGQSSTIYLDLRQIVSYPRVLKMVSEAMWPHIKDLHYDLICGVPYTALPIATCISLLYDKPMIMRRKEKKSYGTKLQIEGNFKPDQNCLIIEDIITSGMSILETVNDLQAEFIQISDAIVLINREQGGEDNLHKNNIKLHAVLTLREILQELLTSKYISQHEVPIIKNLLIEFTK